MPTLEWIGKSKVINHHQEVPFRVLDRKYSFDENGQHSEDNGSENMIIRGDNLEALKALLPRYEGRVKCIYIDPPYNTGNEGWVYNDNVNDPKIKKWLGEVVGKEGEDLTRHDKWLCMMYPRLKLLQKLLADDGVVFISIGDDEEAHLRMICDDIFGSTNFIATFVWKSRAKPSNTGAAKVKPQNDAEYVFCYGKSKNTVFQLVYSGKERSYPVISHRLCPQVGAAGRCDDERRCHTLQHDIEPLEDFMELLIRIRRAESDENRGGVCGFPAQNQIKRLIRHKNTGVRFDSGGFHNAFQLVALPFGIFFRFRHPQNAQGCPLPQRIVHQKIGKDQHQRDVVGAAPPDVHTPADHAAEQPPVTVEVVHHDTAHVKGLDGADMPDVLINPLLIVRKSHHYDVWFQRTDQM